MSKKEFTTIGEAIEFCKSYYEKAVKEIKKNHDELVKDVTDTNTIKNMEYNTISLIEAEKIFSNIKIAYIAHEKFTTLDDAQKIDYFSKDFKEFHTAFPIVFKYMVCFCQYNQKAFKKYLKLSEEKLKSDKKDKDFMQEQWIHCNASYLRYLWEESNRKRFTRQESNFVFQQSYKALSDEFKTFKKLHDDTEKKIKEDKKRYKAELIKELINRMKESNQKLPEKDISDLKINIQNIKYKQIYDNIIKEFIENKTTIKPLIIGYGNNEELGREYQEELKMFETKKNFRKMELPNM